MMSNHSKYKINDILIYQNWLIVQNVQIEKIIEILEIKLLREDTLISLYPYLIADNKWDVPTEIYTPSNDYVLIIEYLPSCFLISGKLVENKVLKISKLLSKHIGTCHHFDIDWNYGSECWSVSRKGILETFVFVFNRGTIYVSGDLQIPEMQYIYDMDTNKFQVADFIKTMTNFDKEAFETNLEESGQLKAFVGRGDLSHIAEMNYELPNKGFFLTDLIKYKKEHNQQIDRETVDWDFLESIKKIEEVTDSLTDYYNSLPF